MDIKDRSKLNNACQNLRCFVFAITGKWIDLNDDFLDVKYSKIEGLTLRDIEIIAKRYGFYLGCAQTLEEIGNDYNITRERVRQIESKTLRQIRRG